MVVGAHKTAPRKETLAVEETTGALLGSMDASCALQRNRWPMPWSGCIILSFHP